MVIVKRKWTGFIVAVLFFLPSNYVFADEGHSHSTEEKEITHEDHGTEHAHQEETETVETENNQEKSIHEEHGVNEKEAISEGGHGHSLANVVETPPNLPVLSVFGALNLSFLIVGLWNKRFRKRVNDNAGKKA